jgi:myosin-crossreactive antigen
MISTEGAESILFVTPALHSGAKAWLVGGGIASMSAAAFLIRDGNMLGLSIPVAALGNFIKAAQMAVLQLLGLERRLPPVYKGAFDPRVLFKAIAPHDLGARSPERVLDTV